MELSVVIASHQDSLGLYLTLFSVIQQLEKVDFDWEVIVAADAGTDYKYEKQPNVKVLRLRMGSPQGTRDSGIRAAKYNNVLCIESHVIVSDICKFLDRYLEIEPAMLFPTRIAEGPEQFNVYGTETDWDGNLWFKRTLYSPPKSTLRFYRVPQFGHSCFMIDRQKYLDIGGYTDLLTGWGGEEVMLCLRFWMLGYDCWQTKDIWHAHFLDNRGAGNAMASSNFTRNFQIVKYVLSGERGNLNLTPEMLAERQRIKNGPFEGDLQKLRLYFKREGIG